MIEIQCTAQGVPLEAMPKGTIATLKKGEILECFSDIEEYNIALAKFEAEQKKKYEPTPEELSKQQIGAYVDRLDAFCAAFIKGMKVENIGLGIGQADTKIVQHITDTTAAALNAVALGSLRVAIDQISIIPADQLDGHFLTEARLTAKRNEIEVFLGIPKSKVYNE